MILYIIPVFLVVLVVLLFTVLVSPPTQWLERWDKKKQAQAEEPGKGETEQSPEA